MSDELCFLPAVELARRLRDGELSAVEVLEAHLAQIERVNPQVNAIITLVAEQAHAAAIAADQRRVSGADLGSLHGLPIAHKDLADTAGIRTTYGSPLYRDHIPQQDALIVSRLRQAGAITIGKTNVPEFGAGSQTFNPLFGATRNPYDTSKTCGGSSGGAAVALACGMQPLADGSDMGGSLRNPASFCNVVGLRPSPGRVPHIGAGALWSPLSVDGPMARTVADVALMLSAIAGPEARDPLSISESGAPFAAPLERELRGVRVAWSRDMGGLPFDPQVATALEPAREVLTALGCDLADAEPDFSGADLAFKTWRAWQFALGQSANLAQHREQLKDTVIWNVEAGLRLTAADLIAAEQARTALFGQMHTFFEQYDFLVCPTVQVPPFDVELPYIREINGQPCETYIDWMRSCYYVSATAHPAISVPGGFTPEGLPIGLQIVGRYRDEWGVLQLAHAFETATSYWQQRSAILS